MAKHGHRESLPPMGDDEATAFMQAEHDKLTIERNFFEANREVWVRQHPNTYVLVRGREAHGFFPSFEEAYEEGERKFGDTAAMLIKRVAREDDVISISPALLHGNLVIVE